MPIQPHVLILAAGQGKRMKSSLPKVLHPVLYQPMLHHVIDLALSLPHSSVSVVVGHGEEAVRESCKGYADLKFFRQTQQLGTADAVRAADAILAEERGQVLVLSGDVILLQRETLVNLMENFSSSSAACALVTARLESPRGYGRILRSQDGNFVRAIREDADCSATEKDIREINCGIYCFDVKLLRAALSAIGNRNKQNEFYLTDVVEHLSSNGHRVVPHVLAEAHEAEGVNDRTQLAKVEKILQSRTNQLWMQAGVSFQDPDTTWISAGCELASDVYLEAGTRVVRSKIGTGSVVESSCRIVDTEIGEFCQIKQGSYLVQSRVASQCAVGPYAHLRPKSVLARGVKLGNFVEVKNSLLGEGSKASHLSYIGDAEVGKNVNLGCGFITCNFDGGSEKHKTTIEDDVFVGSDSQMVAPVRVGRGAYIASGTTVTEDVPAESLALSRGRQITKEGYAAKIQRRRDQNVKKK